VPLAIDPQPFAPRNHDQFDITAEGLGTYTIDVSLPGNMPAGARLPVILVVDGNLLFDVVQTAVHGRMASVASLLPPSIVVGVGYPQSEGFSSFYARRNFDFHGPWDLSDPMGCRLQEILDLYSKAEAKPPIALRSGGFSRFLQFLRDELLPGLAGHYPVDVSARHTLIGDSSGGHFALRALFDPASPFSRYVVISPSFGAAGDTIKEAEAAYAAAHGDLAADVFLCAGTVETAENADNGIARFGSGVIWCAEQLAIRQWPSARVEWEIMNNEDHASIAPRAVAAGLRSVHRLRPGVHRTEIANATAAFRDQLAK